MDLKIIVAQRFMEATAQGLKVRRSNFIVPERQRTRSDRDGTLVAGEDAGDWNAKTASAYSCGQNGRHEKYPAPLLNSSCYHYMASTGKADYMVLSRGHTSARQF